MPKTNLNIVLLRTFVAAAKGESFAGAALDIFRTQAAVSQQMQRLEALVGCKLFEQVGRRKQLTGEGTRLLDYARQIIRLNDDACRAMKSRGPDVPVRVGACPDAIDSLLPEYLALAARTLPGLRIEILPGRSEWLASALRRGAIDLLVDIVELTGIHRTTLRTSPMVWIAGGQFQHQPGAPLPLVLTDSPCVFREHALPLLEQEGVAWRLAYTSATLAGLRAALRAGLGVTPRSVEMMLPDLKVLGESYGLPRLPSVNFYLYRRESDNSDSARAVLELFE
jgi:DNA-binding transcriptional LysR family regulator